MNWIDNHSRVDEGVTVRSCRETVYFLHTIWYWLHVLKILQHTLDRFSAACEKYRGRLLGLSANPRQCMRLVSANTLQQVEKLQQVDKVPRGGIYQWRKAERGD